MKDIKKQSYCICGKHITGYCVTNWTCSCSRKWEYILDESKVGKWTLIDNGYRYSFYDNHVDVGTVEEKNTDNTPLQPKIADKDSYNNILELVCQNCGSSYLPDIEAPFECLCGYRYAYNINTKKWILTQLPSKENTDKDGSPLTCHNCGMKYTFHNPVTIQYLKCDCGCEYGYSKRFKIWLPHSTTTGTMHTQPETKPPLGISPEWFFEADRIKELTRAINEYVNHDISDPHITRWIDELSIRLNKLNNMEKKV